MNLIFIIPYRSISNQIFRKQELDFLIDNIKQVMEINNTFSYKINIIEQNNEDLFNRAALLNIGFIEANKNETNSCFIHCNTDYTMPLSNLPYIFNEIPKGFIDVHGFPDATLGGFVLFDAQSFIDCNGFPNNIYGWGGEDWAIWKRIFLLNINIVRPKDLYNKWIIEKKTHFRDCRHERQNRILCCKINNISEIFNNGLNTCVYTINETIKINNISWYKVNFNYK